MKKLFLLVAFLGCLFGQTLQEIQEHFQTIDINKNGKIYKIRIEQ